MYEGFLWLRSVCLIYMIHVLYGAVLRIEEVFPNGDRPNGSKHIVVCVLKACMLKPKISTTKLLIHYEINTIFIF